MGRRFLMCEVELPIKGVQTKIKIGTVHLESLANAEMRQAQLNLIYPLLAQYCDHSFLMGDFNFCGTSWENEENVAAHTEYVDVWPTLTHDDQGLSMPGEGRYVVSSSPHHVNSHLRYDRVLVRSALFAPTEIRMLGTEAVATEGKRKYKPSDHLGVFADVSLKE